MPKNKNLPPPTLGTLALAPEKIPSRDHIFYFRSIIIIQILIAQKLTEKTPDIQG